MSSNDGASSGDKFGKLNLKNTMPKMFASKRMKSFVRKGEQYCYVSFDPNDDLSILLVNKRVRMLEERLMRERVGSEMKTRLDTGVRVNRQLASAFGVAAPLEPADDDEDVTCTVPKDCAFVTQTRLEEQEALKSGLALVAIVLM